MHVGGYEYTQTVATIFTIISAPLMVVQTTRELVNLPRLIHRSKEHLNSVTNKSIEDESYMAACLLILLTRAFAALFSVINSSVLVVSVLFLHLSDMPSPWLDVISLLFIVASSIFLFGTLAAAKRFSETVRRKIDPAFLQTRTIF
jgi:hypothetical protein